MKKILYSTTMLASILLSSQPFAQTRSTRYLQQNDMVPSSFQTNINGFMNMYGGYMKNNNEGNTNEFDILNDVEVHFEFLTTLKNNTLIGAKVELETGTGNDGVQFDHIYAYGQGQFGKLIVGTHYNVSKQLGLYSTDIGPLFLQETDLFNIVLNPLLTNNGNTYEFISNNLSASYINTDEALTKISYITPKFYGLQAGITYAPPSSTNGIDANVTRPISTPENITIDATVFAIAYNSHLQELNFGLSLGYAFNTIYNETSNIGNLDQYNIGGKLSYKNFSLTSAYKRIKEDTNNDANIWDIGIQYKYDKYAASLGYIAGSSDNNAMQNTFLLSGTYEFSQGIDTFASFGWGDYEDTENNKNDGWTIITGMMLTF